MMFSVLLFIFSFPLQFFFNYKIVHAVTVESDPDSGNVDDVESQRGRQF